MQHSVVWKSLYIRWILNLRVRGAGKIYLRTSLLLWHFLIQVSPTKKKDHRWWVTSPVAYRFSIPFICSFCSFLASNSSVCNFAQSSMWKSIFLVPRHAKKYDFSYFTLWEFLLRNLLFLSWIFFWENMTWQKGASSFNSWPRGLTRNPIFFLALQNWRGGLDGLKKEKENSKAHCWRTAEKSGLSGSPSLHYH